MAEIERKFRLPALPAKTLLGAGVRIAQGYILDGATELRLRREGIHHYLTVKSDGTLVRDEWETEILSSVFDALWPYTAGRRLEKTRYPLPYESWTLEIDEYHGNLNGLVTLECEFADKKSARQFALPDWAAGAIDVTESKAYKNKTLAVAGLPSPPPEGMRP